MYNFNETTNIQEFLNWLVRSEILTMLTNTKIATGGPLFKKKAGGDFVQLALVSWGPQPDQQTTDSWDVNSDVSFYKTWITTNMAAYVEF